MVEDFLSPGKRTYWMRWGSCRQAHYLCAYLILFVKKGSFEIKCLQITSAAERWVPYFASHIRSPHILYAHALYDSLNSHHWTTTFSPSYSSPIGLCYNDVVASGGHTAQREQPLSKVARLPLLIINYRNVEKVKEKKTMAFKMRTDRQ